MMKGLKKAGSSLISGDIATQFLRLAEEADVSIAELQTISVTEFADRLAYARSRRAQSDAMTAQCPDCGTETGAHEDNCSWSPEKLWERTCERRTT